MESRGRVLRFMLSVLASTSLLLALPGASSGASQASDAGFTVEALDNATYRPQSAGNFPDTVQLVNGGYSGTLFSPIGGIHQDSYVFSDLNGDGADDAVAIVIENVSGLGSGLVVLLAAYLNDSDSPTFLDSVGLGRATVVDSVTVESGTITVNGIQAGPNDPFCCPTQAFVKQFKLDGRARLVAVPLSTSEVAGGVPASTVDLGSMKSGFPGQILIPPPDLPPLAALQLTGAYSQTSRSSVNTGQLLREYPQSYRVWFVDVAEQNRRQFGVPSAQVSGAMSRQMYDDTAVDLLKTFTGCAATAAYCARPTFPQCQGLGCTTQSEIFRGLKVKGSDALVEHGQMAKESHWSVTWFDAQAGVTYNVTTANLPNPGDSDAALSAKNQAGAQQLTAVAEKLVAWTGT